MKYLIVTVIVCSLCFTQEVFDGLSLFTPAAPSVSDFDINTLLIDNDNNIMHSWSHIRGPAQTPYLLPDSSIIYPYVTTLPTMINSGVGGGIQKISWDGTILWDYRISDENYQHHHDIEPLVNGNILVIAWERKSIEEAVAMGRIPETIDNPLDQIWSETIFEIQPLDYNNYEIIWEWHFWDHLVQNIDENLPNFGIISDHPELFDINLGIAGNWGNSPFSHADWIHINSIDYNEYLDQIIISSATQDEFFIIDHSTTSEEASGHTGGDSGLGGDFLYRWGNPQNYGRGDASNKILEHQHSVNWIDADCPGAGHIILFNNGSIISNSDILEIQPPINDSGIYYIENNSPYGPENPFWSYEGDFHSHMAGGAFRLPNGNTFITVAQFAHILEIDTNENIVWEYYHPGENIIIPKAQKYSIDYLNNILLGDLNQDGLIDILDIVMSINIVLSGEYNALADLNSDETIDVLDIVQLVNIILN